MWAMIVKEFRQLRRDRRTVAMMVVLPLLLLIVFGYAARFDVDEVRTLVVGPQAEQAPALLPDLFVVVDERPAGTRADAVDALRRGEVVAAVVATARPQVLLDGAELFSAQAALRELRGARPAGSAPSPEANVEILFNEGLDTSAVMVPAIAGMILVFIGTVITSVGVVRERQAGTLEQLAVMPFTARDIFIGKIAPYFLVATVDLVVVIAAGVLLFDVPFEGSVLTLALGGLMFLFVALGTGVLISSVSQNQGQAIQMSFMTVMPQVLLSGMIFPLESMGAGVRWISYLLPLTYFIEVSRGVMVRGAPTGALLFPLGMLFVLSAVVFGGAVARFRRDLAPPSKKTSRRQSPPRAAEVAR